MGRPPETDNLLCSWPPSDSQLLPVVLESSAHLHGAPHPPDTHTDKWSAIVYALI